MLNDATLRKGPVTMSRAEAAHAALASARIEGQPVDARTEEVLLAWGAGHLPDSALGEYADEMERYYRDRWVGDRLGRSPAPSE